MARKGPLLRLLTMDGRLITYNGQKALGRTLEEWLPVATALIDTEGRPHLRETIKLPHVIDEIFVVRTDPDDEIVYAKRPGRDTYSRFVVGSQRPPQQVDKVTVVLQAKMDSAQRCRCCRRTSYEEYRLQKAWLGSLVPWGPTQIKLWTETATTASARARMRLYAKRSAGFWRKHANVLERVRHDPLTVTREVPQDWEDLFRKKNPRRSTDDARSVEREPGSPEAENNGSA